MKTEIFISKRKGRLNISIPLEAVKKLLEEKVCTVDVSPTEFIEPVQSTEPEGFVPTAPTETTTGVPIDNATTAGNPEINPTI